MRALAWATALAVLGPLGAAAWANVAPPYGENTRFGTIGPGRATPARPPAPPPPVVPPIDAGFVDALRLDGGAPRR
ncbi:MAG: hypothetical protein K1X89_32125 [Myxococcaceae bacterium]|nr:hypothetical protein [Myxococcaceae bacterium]